MRLNDIYAFFIIVKKYKYIYILTVMLYYCWFVYCTNRKIYTYSKDTLLLGMNLWTLFRSAKI